MPPAQSRHPDRVAYRVKRLFLLASHALDELLKPYGVGRGQWQVLSRLDAAQGRPQRELQTMLHVEPATLSAIVDSLVCKGWVERAENPADKRGRILHLSAKGAELVSSIPDPTGRDRGPDARRPHR